MSMSKIRQTNTVSHLCQLLKRGFSFWKKNTCLFKLAQIWHHSVSFVPTCISETMFFFTASQIFFQLLSKQVQCTSWHKFKKGHKNMAIQRQACINKTYGVWFVQILEHHIFKRPSLSKKQFFTRWHKEDTMGHCSRILIILYSLQWKL